MSLFSFRSPALAAALVLLPISACAPLKSHQGYVVDSDLVGSIQPGVDNRQSVLATLGKPTLTSQFNEGDWYYVSRETRNMAYNNPRAVNQVTMRIRFDANGNVASIDKTGPELIASVSPYGKTTPTLGRHRGFFEDLFGNIGTVGAPGTGGPGGGGGDNTGP